MTSLRSINHSSLPSTSFLRLFQSQGEIIFIREAKTCVEQRLRFEMLPSIGAQTVLLFANIALVTGRSLSSTVPATHGTRSSDIYLLKKAYPVGNGKLGGEDG